jgi:hypothetical protein
MLHINNTNKYGVTALQGDRTKGKLEIFRYLTKIGLTLIFLTPKTTALFFTTLLNLVVGIISSYYWIKECLLT